LFATAQPQACQAHLIAGDESSGHAYVGTTTSTRTRSGTCFSPQTILNLADGATVIVPTPTLISPIAEHSYFSRDRKQEAKAVQEERKVEIKNVLDNAGLGHNPKLMFKNIRVNKAAVRLIQETLSSRTDRDAFGLMLAFIDNEHMMNVAKRAVLFELDSEFLKTRDWMLDSMIDISTFDENVDHLIYDMIQELHFMTGRVY
jgi:hypothetical protein